MEHTLTAEKMHSICLSLHYDREDSYLFVNGTDIYKFKAKDSDILACPWRLGNISKDWSTDNMKKTGFHDNVYSFSVHYVAITVNAIKDIHKYLMKKTNLV